MWVHGVVGTLAGITTIFSCGYMYRDAQDLTLYKHQLYGLFFFILSPFMVIGGILDKIAMEKLTWSTYLIRTGARIHKYFALILLVYAQLCIYSGIEEYYTDHQPVQEMRDETYALFLAHIILHLVLFLILEVVFRLWRNKSGPLTFRQIHNTMSTEEYEQAVKSGKKFCILDDFVLDVSLYASRHPGGRFLIDATVGRDVSKYFYGGYKMENAKSNKDGPYRHSMMARKTVSTLIVARLNNPGP